MTRFDYIETAFGGVQNRNNLIIRNNLRAYARDWKNKHVAYVDCYTTYFMYPEEMLEHFKQNNSVKGYTGPIYYNTC